MPKKGLYDPRFEHDSCGVGFVAHLKGQKSHTIVRNGIQVLENLSHRGACGCDPETGDGAGITIQMPDAFLRKKCAQLHIDLPPLGDYGAGIVFLPPLAEDRNVIEQWTEHIIREEGQKFLGWREVPHDPTKIGKVARSVMPAFKQLFIGRGKIPPPTLSNANSTSSASACTTRCRPRSLINAVIITSAAFPTKRLSIKDNCWPNS